MRKDTLLYSIKSASLTHRLDATIITCNRRARIENHQCGVPQNAVTTLIVGNICHCEWNVSICILVTDGAFYGRADGQRRKEGKRDENQTVPQTRAVDRILYDWSCRVFELNRLMHILDFLLFARCLTLCEPVGLNTRRSSGGEASYAGFRSI